MVLYSLLCRPLLKSCQTNADLSLCKLFQILTFHQNEMRLLRKYSRYELLLAKYVTWLNNNYIESSSVQTYTRELSCCSLKFEIWSEFIALEISMRLASFSSNKENYYLELIPLIFFRQLARRRLLLPSSPSLLLSNEQPST